VQVVQRLTSIVNFWGERKVFGPGTVAMLMSVVTSPVVAPSLASVAPAAAAAQVDSLDSHKYLALSAYAPTVTV